MGRKKKITDEQLIALLQEYSLNNPNQKIKIPELGSFVRSNGFDVADYLIRNNKRIRDHIDTLNERTISQIEEQIVVYHPIDVEVFIQKNSTKEKMRTALSQRDLYYSSIASSAASVFKENAELKKQMERCQRENNDLRSQLKLKIMKLESTEIKDRDAIILQLRNLLNTYVYPEMANELLKKEGLLEKVDGIIPEKNKSELLISADSAIPKYNASSETDKNNIKTEISQLSSVRDLLEDFD